MSRIWAESWCLLDSPRVGANRRFAPTFTRHRFGDQLSDIGWGLFSIYQILTTAHRVVGAGSDVRCAYRNRNNPNNRNNNIGFRIVVSTFFCDSRLSVPCRNCQAGRSAGRSSWPRLANELSPENGRACSWPRCLVCSNRFSGVKRTKVHPANQWPGIYQPPRPLGSSLGRGILNCEL